MTLTSLHGSAQFLHSKESLRISSIDISSICCSLLQPGTALPSYECTQINHFASSMRLPPFSAVSCVTLRKMYALISTLMKCHVKWQPVSDSRAGMQGSSPMPAPQGPLLRRSERRSLTCIPTKCMLLATMLPRFASLGLLTATLPKGYVSLVPDSSTQAGVLITTIAQG